MYGNGHGINLITNDVTSESKEGINCFVTSLKIILTENPVRGVSTKTNMVKAWRMATLLGLLRLTR